MQSRKVLQYLENLAEKLGIDILYEKLGEEEPSIRGGICKAQKTYKIFIDQAEPTDGRIKMLTRALSSFDTEEVYLPPFVREILENARTEE
jgi:hypothetical protein